ncbi:MAG: hypothetical protein R2939_01985 [Kofleriaceae bacterium]
MLMRAVVIVSVAVLGTGCASPTPKPAGGPKTAAEKQRLEFEQSGEEPAGGGGKWGAWKYQGDRKDCFYVLGRQCFKTEEAACKAAACKEPATCKVSGAGPAIVACE